ncbi:CPBP family intramembrane glutamic endopeptidase [Variovorax sp. LT1R20]|uniref:CPBP family intramembrane glutamic endopeptidase n=1 Tax=unclassified Variovorax TaxID=663243 RepID=UPI0019821936|nr:CPBP family intramembrane glutamic endopeptidase [Variovorax sp. RKNM96]
MKQPPLAPNATPMEALGMVALCFGWFILGSLWSVSAGFRSGAITDASLLGIVGFELLIGPIALLVLRSRGYVVADLLPSPSWIGCGVGALLYIACVLAAWIAVAPFASSASQPIDELVATARPSFAVVLVLSVVNGLYEEVFLLGYLMKGFRHRGASFALGLSLLVRVLYHLYQGPNGALSIAVVGLVFGVFYLRTGWLWPVVFAHMLADTLPFL